MAVRELKVRLPGTLSPCSISIQNEITAKELIEKVTAEYNITDAAFRKVVVPPTVRLPGRIIEPDQRVDFTLEGEECVIELWKAPYLINVGMTQNTIITSHSGLTGREIAVDYSTILTNLVPVFQKAFSLNDEIFCFKYAEFGKDGAVSSRCLSASKSLQEQNFASGAWLIIVPVSILFKQYTIQAIEKIEKEGMLIKQPLNADNDEDEKNPSFMKKMSSQMSTLKTKRRYCVLSDSMLFYFKAKEDKQPAGVIPLDYYSARLITTRKDNVNRVEMLLKLQFRGFSSLKNSYIFRADKPKNAVENSRYDPLREWYEAIKPRCMQMGDTKVFGVDLRELIERSKTTDQAESGIPRVLSTTIAYLDCNALEVEGLFRQSGSASLVEYLKDQVDQGVQLDLSKIADPHSVAALLKLYLRELPEPLLTYDLYDQFIESHAKGVDKEKRRETLLALVNVLPIENQIILKYVCAFLSRVAECADVNKMTKANIGTVFGPNLLKSRELMDMQREVQDSAIVSEITQTLIEEYPLFFSNVTEINYNAPPLRAPKRQKEPPTAPIEAPHKAVPSFTNEEIDTLSKSLSLHPTSATIVHSFSAFGLVKEGYLLKKGLTISGWNERWFRLFNGRLHYYPSSKVKRENPSGTINLRGVKLAPCNMRNFCFSLSQGDRSYFIAASSSPDYEDWMTVLKNAIDEADKRQSTMSLGDLEEHFKAEYLVNVSKEEDELKKANEDPRAFARRRYSLRQGEFGDKSPLQLYSEQEKEFSVMKKSLPPIPNKGLPAPPSGSGTGVKQSSAAIAVPSAKSSGTPQPKARAQSVTASMLFNSNPSALPPLYSANKSIKPSKSNPSMPIPISNPVLVSSTSSQQNTQSLSPPGSPPKPTNPPPPVLSSHSSSAPVPVPASDNRALPNSTVLKLEKQVEELKHQLEQESRARQSLEKQLQQLSAQLQDEANERKKLEAKVQNLFQIIENTKDSNNNKESDREKRERELKQRLELEKKLHLQMDQRRKTLIDNIIDKRRDKPKHEDDANTKNDFNVQNTNEQLNENETRNSQEGDSNRTRVKAVYAWNASSGEELTFKQGDVIEVIKEDDSGWWTGSLNGKEGKFPANYVAYIR